jgi:N-acyl amino acid synthase of PEP-CTERM/exosortase system
LSPASDKLETKADPQKGLLGRFNSHFKAIAADTPSLVETALTLRYQVYCLERQFEDAGRHAEGLEQDDFDRHALHALLIHKGRDEAIGTARLILPEPRPDSLPILSLLRRTGIKAADFFPVRAAAEISRFAISKQVRRRADDNDADASAEQRSSLPALGLIQMLLRQSIDLGISYWTAVMEPRMMRMWISMGMRMETIGPLVSHHGLRQPCYCYLPEMLQAFEQLRPDNWAIVTNGGELHPAAVRDRAALFAA